ncbi:MAG: glycosyltransferase [Candidatus Kuenenbacteria bacterium]
MKILYISNSRIPTVKAYGHQIMKMCQVFAAQKVAVELVCPTRKNPQFKSMDPFEYYHIKKIFKIKKILSYDPHWMMKLPQGTYIKFQLAFFTVSLFIYLLFKKNKAEYIFYTRDEYLLPVLHLFSKRVVWEGHSLPRRKKYYAKYFKKCHRIAVLTQELKKMLIKLGVSQDKILVSPDAVELEIFAISESRQDARQKLKLPKNKIILGYTGSFKTKNMDKGIQDILNSIVILKEKNIDILFVAVGGSQADIDFYLSMAKDLKVQDRALFLDKVDQSALALYGQAFDILLMPFPYTKHYAYFMSPLKMFEYMAAKRPIIATHLPSIKEVLNQENSIFVKPDNPQDLAQGIITLIYNPNLACQLAKQAFIDVKQYTWQKRAERIIGFLIF